MGVEQKAYDEDTAMAVGGYRMARTLRHFAPFVVLLRHNRPDEDMWPHLEGFVRRFLNARSKDALARWDLSILNSESQARRALVKEIQSKARREPVDQEIKSLE